MAGQLTDAQIAKMREQFVTFSQDGSGKVTADQMIQVYGALGIALSEEQKQEIRKAVLAVDPSGGPISADDYLARMQMTDSAMAAFKMFDKDNSGYIDKNEIIQGMAQLGMQVTEEEAEEMLQEADTDGDGRINYEEFAKTFQ
ncbi:calmodulin-like [Branchiostoma floridae]|uniref:Calmodulin-like n=1 Tax=Branchiostoma floridae TaxID=7739 RepID=C3YLJ0_BRAFL|nr:calmodulin-like [Branchiostoma floridae]|eukprot:XP_002602915.1 hypothetical protein BRAFLDRAFT_283784 [Branchiostoma floridae]